MPEKLPEKFANSPEAVLKTASVALADMRCNNCSLDEWLDSDALDKVMRRRAGSLLFALFRNRRRINEALSKCYSKAPAQKVYDLLALALTMGTFQDSLPSASVVNIAVTLAKKEFGKACGGFVNAVLRKALVREELASKCVLPLTLEKRWKKSFGSELAQTFSGLLLDEPVNTVRLRSNFELPDGMDYCTELDLDLPWRFYQCDDLGALLQSEAFEQGAFYIQDPAPAKIAGLLQEYHMLLPTEVKFVDLCAAPGGKLIMNMELLKSLQHNVAATAVDRSSRRLELVKKNLIRCKLSAEVHALDAAELADFADNSFELVTCDVPCSNSGVFRHRPDALWRWRVEDLREITALQKKILREAARVIAPGGLLLYSTCSLEAEENEGLISNFLKENSNFELKKAQLFMPEKYCDGTFGALLQKKC